MLELLAVLFATDGLGAAGSDGWTVGDGVGDVWLLAEGVGLGGA